MNAPDFAETQLNLVAWNALRIPVTISPSLLEDAPFSIMELALEEARMAQERRNLPSDERIAYDLRRFKYAESGSADVAARVAEGAYEDWDEGDPDHVWDEPIRLAYAR